MRFGVEYRPTSPLSALGSSYLTSPRRIDLHWSNLLLTVTTATIMTMAMVEMVEMVEMG
jgi:hypothetical protein